MTNSNLDNLKIPDIYSLLMFVLFKAKEVPEYSTLSELVYMLDKDSLLKLCQNFGGMTIKIPTLDDIEILIYSLLMYQRVNVENQQLDIVAKEFQLKSYKLKQIKQMYIKLCNVLEEYDFEPRA